MTESQLCFVSYCNNISRSSVNYKQKIDIFENKPTNEVESKKLFGEISFEFRVDT